MKYSFTKSIRLRIIASSIVFGLMVIGIFSFLILFTFKINDDELFNWHLDNEVTSILDSYKNGVSLKELSQTHSGLIMKGTEKEGLIAFANLYEDKKHKKLLSQINSFKDLKTYGPKFRTDKGFFNIEYRRAKQAFHILIADLPNSTSEKLFYFIEITGFTYTSAHSFKVIKDYMAIAIVVVIILALTIGYFMANTIIGPLTNLAKEIDHKEGHQRLNLEGYYDDEVGSLAYRFNEYLKRMANFIEREKSFTRDASHELRTPVASSSAALEVLEELLSQDKIKYQGTLDRIKRANTEMKGLIETFLILSRENMSGEDLNECHIKETCLLINTKYQNLYNQKKIKLNFKSDSRSTIQAPQNFFNIIIDNILRNYYQHSTSNEVTIETSEKSIKFYNQEIEGMSEKINYGIGLKIITKICEILQWNVEFKYDPELGFYTVINFD